MLKACEPCCFSASSDSRSGLGSLLGTATDALQTHNSRGHRSTTRQATPRKRCSTGMTGNIASKNQTQSVMIASFGRFLAIFIHHHSFIITVRLCKRMSTNLPPECIHVCVTLYLKKMMSGLSAKVLCVYLLDPAPRTRWSSSRPPHMGSPCPDAVYFAPQP